MRNEGGGFAKILRLRSQLFWHSLSHIRCFSPLRMTKRGDARRCYSSYKSLVTSHSAPLIPSYSSLLSNFRVIVRRFINISHRTITLNPPT